MTPAPPAPEFADIPPFTLVQPAVHTVPFIFNSPHSGSVYPAAFLRASKLDERTIRCSEDLFVDDLFADMPSMGAPLLSANFPRSYLDVNREPYELDPNMFDGRLPSYVNIRSIRVAGGLGTIARVVADSQEIYRARIPVADALHRIETLYKPYHRCLRKIIAATHALHRTAFLIDCHSMPSGDGGPRSAHRPDFVIGDRYGTSCPPELTDIMAARLTDFGYSVSRNKPYAGGFITEHYGRPSSNLHALQLEINRGLYADEKMMTRNPQFQTLKDDLNRLFSYVFATIDGSDHSGFYGSDDPLPLAAE
ncbi:MAG: N-formylglutamate amidohydrolase [Rhizobiales bacterium]|nr:N-formylglutamate amidohydrolase [Hyphomicrobiales bacterium]